MMVQRKMYWRDAHTVQGALEVMIYAAEFGLRVKTKSAITNISLVSHHIKNSDR